jgi:hypothetical protein
MEKINKYKLELVGKKLIRVLHSNQSDGVEHLNGLGSAYYFSTVLELENGKKYCFGNDWIDEWDNSKPLNEVTYKNWQIEKNLRYKNVYISDIIVDELNDVYIKLENNVIIHHTIDYGDNLFFNKYSDLFDSNGKLKED